MEGKNFRLRKIGLAKRRMVIGGRIRTRQSEALWDVSLSVLVRRDSLTGTLAQNDARFNIRCLEVSGIHLMFGA